MRGLAADMVELTLRDLEPLQNGHSPHFEWTPHRAATALDWIARRPAALKVDIAFETLGLDVDVVRERIGYEKLVQRLLKMTGNA